MIAFTSFPTQPVDYSGDYGSVRHHPDVVDDVSMDLDDDDAFEAGGSKLTCPGESLTSSLEYMR